MKLSSAHLIPLPGSGFTSFSSAPSPPSSPLSSSPPFPGVDSPFVSNEVPASEVPANGVIITIAGIRRREAEAEAEAEGAEGAAGTASNRKPASSRKREKKGAISDSMLHLPPSMAQEFTRMKRVLGKPRQQQGMGSVLQVVKGMFDGFQAKMLEFQESGDLQKSHFRDQDVSSLWPQPGRMISAFDNNVAAFRHVYHAHTEVGLIRQCGLSNTDIIPWEYMYGFYPVRPSRDGWRLYIVRNCFNRIVTSRRGFWTFDTSDLVEAAKVDKEQSLMKVLGCVSVANRRRANDEAKVQQEQGQDRLQLDRASPRVQGSLPIYDDVTDLFNTFEVRRIARMCARMGIESLDDREARAHAVWVEENKKHRPAGQMTQMEMPSSVVPSLLHELPGFQGVNLNSLSVFDSLELLGDDLDLPMLDGSFFDSVDAMPMAQKCV